MLQDKLKKNVARITGPLLSAKGQFIVNNSSVIKGYLLLRFYLMQIRAIICQKRKEI